MAVFKARTFQTVSSSGFSNAKKLADLAIKTNVDSEGNATTRGYEEAIQILSQFQYSGKESEALDAQRLVQRYANSVSKINSKKSEINKTIGEFQINEREAFYVTPQTQFRSDTMFDIPEIVTDTTEELRQLVFAVSNAIDEKKLQGNSSAELESYYFELFQRYRMMEELNNDLLNEEISQEEALNGYGIFIDADQNDGEIYGIYVAPIGDLARGLNSNDYKRLEASVGYGGGFIPVYSRFSIDEMGNTQARIGNRVWSGDPKFSLRYDKRKSDDRTYKDEPGGLRLSEFAPRKHTPIRSGEFFKGFTGFSENGIPVQTMFYTSPQGKIYSVDEEAQSLLAKDFGEGMNRAIGVDSEFAKNVLHNEDVVPLNFTPMREMPTFESPPPTTQSQQTQKQTTKQSSFFAESAAASGGLVQSFFNRKNRTNKPDTPTGISNSTPDIIDQGKELFSKANNSFGRQ